MDLLNSTQWVSHVNDLMQQWHIPGLAIAVMQNTTTASKGFGYATIDPPKACTADTLFDIASSSKSLTSGSVGLLVDDNEKYPQVQWDAKMHDLLPDDFVMSQESYTRDLTVEDILSHRSGLPSHDSSYLGDHAAHPDSAKTVTRNLRNLEIAYPIRTKYIYCNLMITVASYLVETISGLSFSDFLHKNIFTPLGMNSTNLQPDAARAAGLGPRMATGYSWHDDERKYATVPYVQSPEAQGAGSIITSVNDYIKWVGAVMNQACPLNPEIVNGVTRPRVIEDPNGPFDNNTQPFTSWTTYAAGWESFYYRGIHVVKHDGLIDGFGTMQFFLPDQKFAGVIFGNSGDSSNTVSYIIMYEFIDEVLNVPRDQRVDWNAQYNSTSGDGDDNDDAQISTLCGGNITSSQPQKIPLTQYTGQYWNAGYHGMVVEIQDDALFVNATDRSNAFYLKFRHICDQTNYIATMVDAIDPVDVEDLAAEFRFENDKVVKMGVKLEEDLEGLIWFDRVQDTNRTVTAGR